MQSGFVISTREIKPHRHRETYKSPTEWVHQRANRTLQICLLAQWNNNQTAQGLIKVTKASISTKDASSAAFLHAVDIWFFDGIWSLLLLWRASGLSVTCIVAVTSLISVETQRISRSDKSKVAHYFYWSSPLRVDIRHNESVIGIYSSPIILAPQHLIICNIFALMLSKAVLLFFSHRWELKDRDAHRLGVSRPLYLPLPVCKLETKSLQKTAADQSGPSQPRNSSHRCSPTPHAHPMVGVWGASAPAPGQAWAQSTKHRTSTKRFCCSEAGGAQASQHISPQIHLRQHSY